MINKSYPVHKATNEQTVQLFGIKER